MTEYLNIFFSSLVIFTFFNGNNFFFDSSTKKNIFKKIVISIIVSFNIFLFFSFFKNGLNYSIYFIYIFLFLNFFGLIKNLFNYKFILFLTINFALFLQIASNPILGWDGLSIWYPKAYNFFTGFDFLNLSQFTKPNYPHLGGFIWAVFWKLSLINYEYLGRFVYIFTFLASLFFVNSFSENNKVRNVLTILILYLVCFDLDLFRGYQEYLIFSFLNIFIVFYYNEKNKLLLFLITIFIINTIIWIKNEALIYCLPIILLYILNQKKLICIENICFLIFTCLFISLRLYMSTKLNDNLNFHGNDFTLSSIINEIFNFSTFGSDLFLIIKHFIISYFKYPIWLLLIFFLVFPEMKIKNRKIYRDTIYIFAFSFFINFLIFHIQRNEILEWHLSTALDRLNLILSGYFIYFVFCNISNYLGKFLSNE